MTLREYCSLVKGEVEVWDAYIDVSIPYYNYDGDFCFEDNDEEHYLHLMENWFLSLPVTSNNGSVCSVDCFHAIEEEWGNITQQMEENGGYESFLIKCEQCDKDETIADYVEDIFTTMSQGYYGIAKDFCCFLDIKYPFNLNDVLEKYYRNALPEVNIDHIPDRKCVYYLPDLDSDLSQGTGNVVVHHYYDAEYNIFLRYVIM